MDKMDENMDQFLANWHTKRQQIRMKSEATRGRPSSPAIWAKTYGGKLTGWWRGFN